jgi:hypothetical protein
VDKLFIDEWLEEHPLGGVVGLLLAWGADPGEWRGVENIRYAAWSVVARAEPMLYTKPMGAKEVIERAMEYLGEVGEGEELIKYVG